MKYCFLKWFIISTVFLSCNEENMVQPEVQEIDNIYKVTGLKITDDNGVLVEGLKKKSLALIKFDESSSLEWEKDLVLKSSDPARFKKVFELENKELVVLYLMEGSMGACDYYLMKIDKEGNKIWNKLFYNDCDIETRLKDSKIIDNTLYVISRNFMVTFNLNSFKKEKIYLTELDSLTTERILFYNNSNHFKVLSTEHMTPGWFIISKFSQSGTFIKKIDHYVDFDSLNLKRGSLGSFILTQDDDIIFYYWTKDSKRLLVRLDPLGNILWTKNCEADTDGYLQLISENEFLLHGKSSILYLNIEGELIGSKNINENNNYFFQNNDIVIQLFFNENMEYWITKTPLIEFFNILET
jgi:hypothetical protein